MLPTVCALSIVHTMFHTFHTCSYNDKEIEEEVSALRTSLSQKSRTVDHTASGTHLLAEASEAKKQQLKNAFGISENYVEGSAFSRETQARWEAQEKTEGEEKTE